MSTYLVNGVAIIAANQSAALAYHFRRLRGETVATCLNSDAVARHCAAGGRVIDSEVEPVEPAEIDAEAELDARQRIRDAELQAIGYMVVNVSEMSAIRVMSDIEFAGYKAQIVGGDK